MNVTALIPVRRNPTDQQRKWLRDAVGSLPVGMKRIIIENDGEVGTALNEGAKAADTEFVFRLDADDVLKEDCLAFLVSLAWDCDIAYPSMAYINEASQATGLIDTAPFFCPNRLKIWNYICGGSLIRRETALEVGWRDLEILEDWDFYVRAHRAGARFKAVPEAIYYYRDVAGSRNKDPQMADDPVAFRDHWWQEIVGEPPPTEATFVYQASYPPAYYRCLAPGRLLGSSWDWTTFPFDQEAVRFHEARGALVLQFPGDPGRGLALLSHHDQGGRVLVDVDDNYLIPGPTQGGWVEKTEDRSSWHSRRGHKLIVEVADGLIVTTRQLAKVYRDLNRKIYVCPNQIEPADWPALEKPDDGIFRVGWFASGTHGMDRHLLKHALAWASRQPNVEIVTMGYNLDWQVKRRHIPWTNDMGTYRRMLMQLDVGLAPVAQTPWSACRSDLKAIEYSMAGALPLVSDAAPYADYEGPIVRALRPKDFLHELRRLVSDPDETRARAREAREYVLRERTVERNIWRWQEAIQG